MTYLSTTFSPSMLREGVAIIREVEEKDFKKFLQASHFHSIVGHKPTAEILSRRFGVEVPFNRESVSLVEGQKVLVAVPQIRFSEAREFSEKEVSEAPFRFFEVEVVQK